MNRKTLASALGLTLLAGCATAPQPLRGEFAEIAPEAADQPAGNLRWGGRVIDVLPAANETCLEVLGMPLDARARPRDLDADIGRFRACKSGFLDPAVFVPGREVTVTGRVEARAQRQIGEYSYDMPQLRVDTLFLWPERPAIEDIRIHQDPFLGIWPWLPGPVIVYPGPRRQR
ncbi:MAG: Slp/YeaY family lipoprotein [Rhodanobacteraceae bacterium]|nr:Slp/YeaY family lipoprotein [Rhodanobacteraceae bacterium]